MSRRAAAQGRAAALHNDDLAALHHVGDMDGPKVPHWERVATPLGATGITIHKWVNTKTISIPWRCGERARSPGGAAGAREWVGRETRPVYELCRAGSSACRNRFWQIVPFGAPIPTQAQELGPAPAPRECPPVVIERASCLVGRVPRSARVSVFAEALGGDWARGGDGVVPRPTPRRKGPAKQEKSDDSDMDFE